MGTQSEAQPPPIYYETLPALSPSSEIASPSSPSPPSDQTFEPYSVFRNEISLDVVNSVSVKSDAPDFFSLDLDELNPEPQPIAVSAGAEPITPIRGAEPETPAEQRLESGWFRGNRRFRSPMIQLHKEIVDFCDFLSPTPEEQASRNAAVESVFDVIKYIWPNCKAEVFGSFSTGLYLPTSDIDVVILESGLRHAQTGLLALSRALSQRGVAKKIQVIAKARIPIIKFVEKKSGVSFDISFDVDGGPKAAEFIKGALAKWPPIRPLCLILKVFLQQRALNEVYSGGLGSYALLAMLMAMLQNLRDTQIYQEHDLGTLLVSFFDFYGRKLNTVDVGVSCNEGATFFHKSSRGFANKGRPYLISIEDPQTSENDIGKNSFNYFQVKSAFSMAFTTLTNPKIIMKLGPNRSMLGTIIRPDPVLLERKGGCNGGVTFTALLPGAGEPIELPTGEQEEILCNWQFDDEEPLPRGHGIAEDGNTHSSERKRKSSSKDRSRKKKLKENGEMERGKHEESGSRKGKSRKKSSRHNYNDGGNSSRYSGGSPWTH